LSIEALNGCWWYLTENFSFKRIPVTELGRVSSENISFEQDVE
jgi:hypothetical protein